MGTPAKRRKLNKESNESPSTVRSLDYFFGKQKQVSPSKSVGQDVKSNADKEQVELTDEELARKLQAEWDNEAANVATAPTNGITSNGSGSKAEVKENALGGRTERNGLTGALAVQEEPTKASSVPLFSGNKNTLSLQSAGSAEDTTCANIPFDESPLIFNPSKYVSDLQGHWAAEGGNASYALLTRCFVLVNSTQSRIKIVDTLVNMLRVVIESDPGSLLPTVRIKY